LQQPGVSFGLILALLLVFAGATAEEPGDVLARFIEDTRPLQAEFSQAVYAEDQSLLETASGHFWLARPGRFRWQYELPYRQLLVADGERLWIYDEELSQVTVQPQQQVMDEAAGLLLSGQSELAAQFRSVQLSASDGSVRYELQPRSEESGLERVELRFSGEQLEQMVLWDKLGQTTRISISNLQRRLDLAADLFTFTPPEGVDVIGGDGG